MDMLLYANTAAGPAPQAQSSPEGKSKPEGNTALPRSPFPLCCPENWAAGLVGKGGASLVGDPGVESGASFTLPTRGQAAAPFHIREEELG